MRARHAAEREIAPVEPRQPLDRGIEFNLVTAGIETLDCFASTEKSRGNTTIMVPVHLEFAERLRAARIAGIIGTEAFTGQMEGSDTRECSAGRDHRMPALYRQGERDKLAIGVRSNREHHRSGDADRPKQNSCFRE